LEKAVVAPSEVAKTVQCGTYSAYSIRKLERNSKGFEEGGKVRREICIGADWWRFPLNLHKISDFFVFR
jgi:hypothetical protein